MCDKSAEFENTTFSSQSSPNLILSVRSQVLLPIASVTSLLSMKPFKECNIIKDIFLQAVRCLFDNFKNKTEIVMDIKQLQLSCSTI